MKHNVLYAGLIPPDDNFQHRQCDLIHNYRREDIPDATLSAGEKLVAEVTGNDALSSQPHPRGSWLMIAHICFRLFASSAITCSFETCHFTPGVRVMTIRSACNLVIQAEMG